jgi:hypothetical protein
MRFEKNDRTNRCKERWLNAPVLGLKHSQRRGFVIKPTLGSQPSEDRRLPDIYGLLRTGLSLYLKLQTGLRRSRAPSPAGRGSVRGGQRSRQHHRGRHGRRGRDRGG